MIQHSGTATTQLTLLLVVERRYCDKLCYCLRYIIERPLVVSKLALAKVGQHAKVNFANLLSDVTVWQNCAGCCAGLVRVVYSYLCQPASKQVHELCLHGGVDFFAVTLRLLPSWCHQQRNVAWRWRHHITLKIMWNYKHTKNWKKNVSI